MSKQMKYVTKSSILSRELKKAAKSAKYVLEENRRLKKENDAMIKIIASLRESSRPAEELQHTLNVDTEEQFAAPLLDTHQLQLCDETGGGDGGGESPELFNSFENKKEYEEFSDDDSDIRAACEGLLLLRGEEMTSCPQGSGGNDVDVIAAAATLVTFCM
jgi:hypothetical protein